MILGWVILGFHPDGTLYVANGGTIHPTESDAGKVAHLFNRQGVPRGVVYATGYVAHGSRDLLPEELQ